MLFRSASLLALCLMAGTAWAQGGKTLRFVVGYPPGGSGDFVTRTVGEAIAGELGVTPIIDNRPGAAGNLATEVVIKSNDGATLLVASNPYINKALYKKLNYDVDKDLTPITLLGNGPMVIAVNSASPYKTLAELLRDAKSKPGTLSYSTVGPATTQHIAGEAFKRAAGTDFTYAAFTGGALAANAVSGGHVTMVLTNLNEVAGLLDSGKLRPLAVTTRERLDVLPQVPTVIEQGYKDYETVAWFALAAPAGTPAEVVQKIADDLQATLMDPEVKLKLTGAGLYPNYLGPKALSAHIQQEYERYSRIIDEARIKLD